MSMIIHPLLRAGASARFRWQSSDHQPSTLCSHRHQRDVLVILGDACEAGRCSICEAGLFTERAIDVIHLAF